MKYQILEIGEVIFDFIRGTKLLSIFYFFVYNNVFTTTSGGIPHITSGPPPKIG